MDIVVCSRQLSSLFDGLARPLHVDELDAGPGADEPSALGRHTLGVTADNLAYIIYTSGSTGQPKGVAVSHRAVMRFAFAHNYSSFGADDIFIQTASPSFDATTLEVWSALLNGARLLLPPPGALSLHELGALLVEHRVTALFLTTALFNQMVDQQLDSLRGLRTLMAGGDVMSVPHVRRAAHSLTDTNVVCAYGPTENTVFTSCFPVTDPTLLTHTAPIGRPLDNTQMFVLDRHLQLVPEGIPGELYVAGDGLARGYRHRPGLTAERFLPNPFAAEPGQRMYRTGDIVRQRPDGVLEFVGRRDGQVKVRGFRIELGEIEAALNAHPRVENGAVIVRPDPHGDKRILAYAVLSGDSAISGAQLRQDLGQRLPAFMVPSAVVVMDHFPLTGNGKLDRRALPEPDGDARVQPGQYTAPSTATERRLAALWSELLSVEQVGIHDDFFALGGHSLLATQLVSRLRDEFAIELSLRTLFERPTIAQLAGHLDELVGRAVLSAPPIEPVPRDRPLPLSFAQQRLWFLDQLQPGSATYNVPFALRIQGPLDIAALRWSLQRIIARHESLRTRFAAHGGQPVQLIEDQLELELSTVDLSGLPEQARDSRARALATEDAMRPFDLATGPLIRAAVILLAPPPDSDDRILLLTMHHIVSDGWSTGLLIRELSLLYRAYCAGHEPSLPALPVQYADFAVWQRSWLQGDVLRDLTDYWTTALDGLQPLVLPTDRPRPAIYSHDGASLQFRLAPELADRLRAHAQARGATLFMVLLAGFKALLRHYCGQDDIAVGSAIANRNRAETEGLIGFFVNTLVLRTQLSPSHSLSFDALIDRVKQVTLDAYAHQDLPFEQLVEALTPERDTSRPPLFQAMFALQNASTERLALGEATVSLVEPDREIAKFDLFLSMQESGPTIFGTWQYNTALFERTTVARMADHYSALLAALLAEPEQPLIDIPLLSPDERHRLIREHNNTRSAYPERPLHEHFATVVATQPDAIAITGDRGGLSYRQLDDRTEHLATTLESLGVGPEDVVGLCMDRSPDMIIAMLGILKVGAAYVPIDPAYPDERQSFMIHDSGLTVIVCEPAHDDRFAGLARTVHVARATAEPTSRPSRPRPPVTPDNLAYVMYTSGSTGQPKGVAVSHRAVMRFTFAHNYASFDHSDVFIQVASPSFDAATLEIWTALLLGGRLVVPPPGAFSLQELGSLLVEHQVTAIFLTAALFNQMVDQQLDSLRGLRTLIGGGDVMSVLHTRRAAETLTHTEVVCGYGPTESTVFASCYPITEPARLQHTVPIGRPLNNTQVFVLDRYLQLVPTGVPGELYIAGDGLARGYRHRSGLTAERFLPNPFAAEPGQRMYRTGDVVRQRPNGVLEFIGRRDGQVKVRGFRVELGEIAAVLSAHPAVEDGTVIVRPDHHGDKRILAYAVLSG
ncbi:MAG: amino acid adenylation domain-containing protein, partial [Myxococcota bacterium]